MRIRNKQYSEGLVSPPKTSGQYKTAGPMGPEFSDVLDAHKSFDERAGLNGLLLKLDEIGRKLINSFSIYDLIAYQDTLRGVLRETSGRAYELKEQVSPDRRGRAKIYQTVELIDRELAELSKLMLAKQKEPLKILKKLDYIRGLVVDLYS